MQVNRVLFVVLKVKDLRHPEIPMKSGKLHSNSVNSTFFHSLLLFSTGNATEPNSFRQIKENAFRSEARVTELEQGQRRSIPGRQSKDRDLGVGEGEKGMTSRETTHDGNVMAVSLELGLYSDCRGKNWYWESGC
ncbi:hypothetical protein CEXT_362381 [Caerostris extrusa]|uniref:Uncharacterized protein n=1 Tax=Caerostris extrusa TaxID=172846 RepID=A0AAV4WU52_CAEEX|nr:hypothetical protein CEXT_362381 [Caerostris extrusa]